MPKFQPDLSQLQRLPTQPPTINPPVVASSAPPLNLSGDVNPYLRSSVPLAMTTQADALRQFYQKGMPQYRIIPTLQQGVRPTI